MNWTALKRRISVHKSTPRRARKDKLTVGEDGCNTSNGKGTHIQSIKEFLKINAKNNNSSNPVAADVTDSTGLVPDQRNKVSITGK